MSRYSKNAEGYAFFLRICSVPVERNKQSRTLKFSVVAIMIFDVRLWRYLQESVTITFLLRLAAAYAGPVEGLTSAVVRNTTGQSHPKR